MPHWWVPCPILYRRQSTSHVHHHRLAPSLPHATTMLRMMRAPMVAYESSLMESASPLLLILQAAGVGSDPRFGSRISFFFAAAAGCCIILFRLFACFACCAAASIDRDTSRSCTVCYRYNSSTSSSSNNIGHEHVHVTCITARTSRKNLRPQRQRERER